MRLRVLLLVPLFYLSSAQAINVGAITVFINDDMQEVSREISNNTDQARLVNISVTRISSPEEGGTEIPMDVDGELLLSPSRVVLPANAKNNVRFFYNGPTDSQERYYRITWFDTALSLDESRNAQRQALATTSAKIGTILVVTPRQSTFDFALEKGVLLNKGNASYRVIAYGPCRDKPSEQCKENYFDLPGKKRAFREVNIDSDQSHIGLWQGEQYVIVK